MDLGAFVKGESPWYGDRGFAGIAQRGARKPLIAAIEGFAVAGGFEIAVACDLIVAAEGAKLGIPEAKRSLVAAGGALLHLPKRMPYHVVMELALTGDPMPAERFHAFGVVNRLAPVGGALDAALELAAAIAKNGPLALAASKEIVQKQYDWTADEQWAKQGEIAGPVMVSADAKEGASAFKEKRDPVWRGA
jgi:enoyl-CoA hydratase